MSNWFSFCTSVSHDEKLFCQTKPTKFMKKKQKKMKKGVTEKSRNWKYLSDLSLTKNKKMSTAMPQLAEEAESSISGSTKK